MAKSQSVLARWKGYREFEAASHARFAIVACRFNHLIVDRLLEGALDALRRSGGVSDDDVVVAWVPGAFELPLAVKRLADSGNFAGVIALGAVILGWTFVASMVVWGVIKLVIGIRVSEEEEYAGVDLSECGLEAYPEFVGSQGSGK